MKSTTNLFVCGVTCFPGDKNCNNYCNHWKDRTMPPHPATYEVICLDCGKPYEDFKMDMVLPHSQWRLIHPDERGVLCANCIVNRASKIKGAIVIHAIIEFVPTIDKTKQP